MTMIAQTMVCPELDISKFDKEIFVYLCCTLHFSYLCKEFRPRADIQNVVSDQGLKQLALNKKTNKKQSKGILLKPGTPNIDTGAVR